MNMAEAEAPSFIGKAWYRLTVDIDKMQPASTMCYDFVLINVRGGR